MSKRKENQTVRYLSPKVEIGPYFFGSKKFQILFLNTNPYNVGAVNLGWQAIVRHILIMCPFISVRIEYADTIKYANIEPSDFKLIAIHIPFETNYPVAIRMLNQIGFPVLSRERNNSFPIVIAGGVYNPFPLSEFIDIFILGDGRMPMVKLINLCFSEKGNKKKILDLINSEEKIKGIFIPALHSDQKQIFISPELSLNKHPIHTIWSTKDNIYGLPADYLSIMVALGCKFKCPFCLVSHCQGAGNDEIEIDIDKILEILDWRKQFIAIKTVKLFFASSIDRKKLKEILVKLIKNKINVLVGSLNCRQVDEELVALLKQSGQNRITIAPETNQNQRWKVNKKYLTDERILEIVKLANKYYLPMSLYLMYGLPKEADKDIIEVGQLVKKVRKRLDSRLEMQVHCNQVYLKPHTPWQYAEQILPEESMRRFELFQRQFVNTQRVEIKTLDLYSLILQSVLAHGDRQIAEFLRNIALCPPHSPEGLIKRMWELIPNWQKYFAERKSFKTPWSQIIFQDHKILWKRWLTFKR